MASPLSGHTHGSNTPASLTNYQSHSTYQQQQYQNDQQYEQPGLMPADYQGKEVVTGQPPQQGYYAAHQQPVEAPEEKKIFGLRKMTFFLALLAAIFLAGAIGAGVAAGVISGQKSSSCPGSDESAASGTPSSSASASASASSSSEAPSSSQSELATTTRPSSDTEFTAIPLPDESSGLGLAQPLCPGTNLTETEIPGTDLVFVHECGTNYPASDLGNIPMTTMQDCLMLCAAQNVRPQGSAGPCVGVAWVTRSRQGLSGSACWLKSQKNAPEYDSDVESAWLKSISDFADN